MKQIITIAAILIATSGFAQTNSTKRDSLENSYVTANDSPDSTNSSLEMTWEEMEELWEDQEKKECRDAETLNQIYYYSGAQQTHQNAQDYTNYYLRNKKMSLWMIIFGG